MQSKNRTNEKGSFMPTALKKRQDSSERVNYLKNFVQEDWEHKRWVEDIILICVFSQLVVGHCFSSGMHRPLKGIKENFSSHQKVNEEAKPLSLFL